MYSFSAGLRNNPAGRTDHFIASQSIDSLTAVETWTVLKVYVNTSSASYK